ncbi:MAG: hypothetical protein HY329_24150 [Chloroflexi bacterium]|nr:hypothetical protein [Chloroflexota bacterium]
MYAAQDFGGEAVWMRLTDSKRSGSWWLFLYFRWVLANAIGGIFGELLISAVIMLTILGTVVGSRLLAVPASAIFGSSSPVTYYAEVVGAGVGIVIGIGLGSALPGLILGTLQWWALMSHLDRAPSPQWIGATTMGIVTAAIVAAAAFSVHPQDHPFFRLTSGAVGGAVIGLLQWRVLRHRAPYAGWWIAATAFSTWSLSAFSGRNEGVFSDLPSLSVTAPGAAWALGKPLAWAANGLLNGWVLVWLCRAGPACCPLPRKTGGEICQRNMPFAR